MFLIALQRLQRIAIMLHQESFPYSLKPFNIICVVKWPKFLTTDLEIPGWIPGSTRFSEKQWVWNGVRSAS
jgi:hypothetical protein